MTVKELLAQNENIKKGSPAFLNVMAWLQTKALSVDIVSENQLCDEAEGFLVRRIKSRYLCFERHDIDVIELRIAI